MQMRSQRWREGTGVVNVFANDVGLAARPWVRGRVMTEIGEEARVSGTRTCTEQCFRGEAHESG